MRMRPETPGAAPQCRARPGRASIVLALSLAALTSACAVSPDRPVREAPPPFVSGASLAPASIGAEVVALVNAERAAAGLGPVRWHPQLAESARVQASFQARTQTMSHYGPRRQTLDLRLAAAGYPFGSAGENVSRGRVSPLDAVGGWMASPPHRRLLLSPVMTEAGVAMARSDDGTPFWCLVMARRYARGD